MTITEQAHKKHVDILAEGAHEVVETHRRTAPSSSFACDIKDHFSCLYVSCRCDCHKDSR